MSRDKKTPKSANAKAPSNYQAEKNTSSKVEIISTKKTTTKKGK